MTHDLILIAVTFALFHLELAAVAVFALRKVRKMTGMFHSLAPEDLPAFRLSDPIDPQ